MSDVELLNEMKRLITVIDALESTNTNLASVVNQLQDVNTNLVSSIAKLIDQLAEQVLTNTNLTTMVSKLSDQLTQQISTNTNLTSMISKLTDQLTAQNLTNTNLTSMISELQSSVTQLTAVNTKLVEVNIRALDAADKAHIGLPYDDVVVQQVGSDLASYGEFNEHFQASGGVAGSNWGAGKNFYPRYISLEIKSTVGEMCSDYGTGFLVFIKNLVQSPHEPIYFRTFVQQEINPLVYSPGKTWWVFRDETSYTFVDKADEIQISVLNLSGEIVSSITVSLFGIII